MITKVNAIKRLKNIAEVMKKFNLTYVEVEGFKVQMEPKSFSKAFSMPQPSDQQDEIQLIDKEIEAKLKALEE